MTDEKVTHPWVATTRWGGALRAYVIEAQSMKQAMRALAAIMSKKMAPQMDRNILFVGKRRFEFFPASQWITSV